MPEVRNRLTLMFVICGLCLAYPFSKLPAQDPQPESPQGPILIFLLDRSESINLSMNGNPTKALKQIRRIQLKRALLDCLEKLHVADQPTVILRTFGSSVEDLPGAGRAQLKTRQDKHRLLGAVTKFYDSPFTDKEAHLYDAIEEVLKSIPELHKQNPTRHIVLYVLAGDSDKGSQTDKQKLKEYLTNLLQNEPWTKTGLSIRLSHVGKSKSGLDDLLAEVLKQTRTVMVPIQINCTPKELALESFKAVPQQKRTIRLDQELMGYMLNIKLEGMPGIKVRPDRIPIRQGDQELTFSGELEPGDTTPTIKLIPEQMSMAKEDYDIVLCPSVLKVLTDQPAQQKAAPDKASSKQVALDLKSPVDNATVFTGSPTLLAVGNPQAFEKVIWTISAPEPEESMSDPLPPVKLTGKSVVYTFQATGLHMIQAVGVTTNAGAPASKTINVNVTDPPALIAESLPDMSQVEVGKVYTYQLPEGAAEALSATKWQFSDGTLKEGAAITHTIEKEGDFSVTISAESKTGQSLIAMLQYTGVKLPLIINPPKGPYRYNRPVAFSVASKPKTINWTFGDGTTAETTDPAVSHTFSKTGSFTVRADATFADGSKSSYSDQVTVTSVKPIAAPRIVSGKKIVTNLYQGKPISLKNHPDGSKTDIASTAWHHKAPGDTDFKPLDTANDLDTANFAAGNHTFRLTVTGPEKADGTAAEVVTQTIDLKVKSKAIDFLFWVSIGLFFVLSFFSIRFLTDNMPALWRIHCQFPDPTQLNHDCLVAVLRDKIDLDKVELDEIDSVQAILEKPTEAVNDADIEALKKLLPQSASKELQKLVDTAVTDALVALAKQPANNSTTRECQLAPFWKRCLKKSTLRLKDLYDSANWEEGQTLTVRLAGGRPVVSYSPKEDCLKELDKNCYRLQADNAPSELALILIKLDTRMKKVPFLGCIKFDLFILLFLLAVYAAVPIGLWITFYA